MTSKFVAKRRCLGDGAQSFYDRRAKFTVLDKAGQDAMRKVCRLAREVLDIAAAAIKPGVTTDYIDEIVHKACANAEEMQSYPSPLNYNFFPKSVCTSLNEVICHGIPDQRVLVDGDILNIDVTLYHGGYHGDLNETVPHYAGNKAVGAAKEGMCFTIEPMVALGTYSNMIWPDNWTAVTMDGKRTAQFEHTLLVTAGGVEVLTARLPTSPGGPVAYPVAE
ncbi:methionine aminopeptidase 1 [Aspergillus luchuensis]|uniref:Methionine aminopeptidase 1 n=1 Tax=Aspergillus kawachii TaxID=1069201 RepID=A0A146FAS9_ASPKA|nr:methionine aminopeptidase 1 [Aspergillus luchuensis]